MSDYIPDVESSSPPTHYDTVQHESPFMESERRSTLEQLTAMQSGSFAMLQGQIVELNEQLVAMTTERYALKHEAVTWWRGIEQERLCITCLGTGIRAYGSTAIWRGGVGGQAMTNAVCDRCWGSGDRYHTWVDLRKSEAEQRQLQAHLEAMTKERDSWHADATSHLTALCEKQAEVNGLEQQLAALTLTWTDTPPTEPGWYWGKRTDLPPEHTVAVVLLVEKFKGRLLCEEHGEWEPLTEFSTCRWAGPIHPPKEG